VALQLHRHIGPPALPVLGRPQQRGRFGLALQADGLNFCGRAVLVEIGPLMADATLKFYPSVFLANALAAFILNLVRHGGFRPLLVLEWLEF